MCNPSQELSNLGSSIDDRIIQPIVEDPVDAAVMAAATYFGGPIGAAAAKTALELDEGKEFGDALESGAKAGATVYVGQQVLGSTGSDYNYDAEAQTGGFYGESSAPIVDAVAVPASEAAYPTTEVGPTYTPAPGSLQDYLQQTGTIPVEGGATAGAGTFQAALPELTSATVAPSLLSAKNVVDAARAANSLRNLLGQPTAQIPSMQRNIQPYGSVQYPSLSLLEMRPIQRPTSLV